MTWTKQIALALSLAAACLSARGGEFPGVWFDKPTSELVAPKWTRRSNIWERGPLPVGNGYMGAMIFGETEVEELQFNEKSLWAGGPGTDNYRYGIRFPDNHGETFKKVRRLFVERKTEEGLKLGGNLNSDKTNFGKYQNMGSLFFDTSHARADCTDYFRGTDLERALSFVRYRHGGVEYEREFFASYPARAIFSRWSASERGRLSLNIRPRMAHVAECRWEKDTLITTGRQEDNGLPFEVRLRIDARGGRVVPRVEPPPREAIATASSSARGFDPALACDLSGATYWQSGRASKEDVKAWLQVDAGRVVDAKGIVLRFVTALPVRYRLEVSEDGERWRTAVEAGEKPAPPERDYFGYEARVRHVRLAGLDWDRHWRNPLRVADLRLVARDEDPAAPRGPSVEVRGADEVRFTLTAATGYRNHYPDYKGENPSAICERTMAALARRDLAEVRAEHVADYRAIYDRVKLTLGDPAEGRTPSNVRRDRFSQDHADQGYVKLYFDACRYLLIACSRDGSLPANLQGVWCDTNFPMWNSDYHTNINVQMNYWAASVCGMGECLEPFFDYIEGLVEPGSVMAEAVYGARGWTVNTGSNAWGYTAPDNLKYGWAPYGSSWLMQRMWEHYAFTGDREFLRRRAYPILKDIALFWEDYLTEDTDGTLVSSPSFSPEHGPTTVAATFDQEMAWNHLTNCIDASEALGVDEDLRAHWTKMRDRLSPLKIGKWGQLQEWKEDIDDPKDRHRHINHLFAVYPGRQVCPVTTPELAAAARISIRGRGESGPGWSTAWKVGILARLGDAEGTHRKVCQLAKDTYYNMFGAHRRGGPFQFESNGGGSSAVPEMILQSHMGFLHLLPALPEAWPEGKFEGLRARRGHVVDVVWKGGALARATIRSTEHARPGPLRVRYRGVERSFSVRPGGSVVVTGADFRR
jgi:hypothetical protein